MSASERLRLAEQIARRAGAVQRERFEGPRTIETKSSEIDLVTDVDRACDALIREAIVDHFPDDTIVTEEDDPRVGSTGFEWIVDPLDGTTNYAHGFPHFAVSIGIRRDGAGVAGAIYDPMKDEMFAALGGGGAVRNGVAMRVSETTTLERSLLATGFAYDVHSSESDNLEFFGRFIKRARAVRRAGSAALDLAYLACGRFDGFWELHLHVWDVAAGLVLISEAGGRVSDFDGEPAPDTGVRLLASNGRVHDAMVEVLDWKSSA